MSQISPFFVLFLCLTFSTGYAAPQTAAVKFAQADECGQTLHVSDTARIEHHFGSNYTIYEACPWIIRVDSASSLHFALEWPDPYFNQGAKVTIAAVNINRDTPQQTTELSSLDLTPQSSSFEATLNGSVAVIVFRSFASTGRGFALTVTRVGSSDIIYSPNSVDEVYTDNNHFSYPSHEGIYTSNELSVLMLAPQHYWTNCNGVSCGTMKYTEKSLEGGCFDRVDVFGFDNTFTDGWRHLHLLCGGAGQLSFNNLGELALIIFASDGAYEESGFDIEFDLNIPHGC